MKREDAPLPALDPLAEAARWRVRLAEDGVESSAMFELWLSEPANADAWEQVDGPWRDFGEAATAPEMMAARETALRRARSARRGVRSGPGMKVAASLAAGLLLVTAWGGWRWTEAQPDVYRTGLGERRTIALEDGSVVALDSSTEVRVRYTDEARRLELVSGQARFDVAKRASRPFTVQAHDHLVIATGTAFNVDLAGADVLVTLIEGRVTVAPDDHGKTSPAALLREPEPRADVKVLSPGERLRIKPSAPLQVDVVTADRATAWEAGQIVFENESLASAAARVSRYGREGISVDRSAAGLRVTGVFKTGDRAAFLDAVTSYLPVEAAANAKGDVVLRHKIDSAA
jgi:transmembrane sensor